jgi:hypothetical protein
MCGHLKYWFSICTNDKRVRFEEQRNTMASKLKRASDVECLGESCQSVLNCAAV